MHFQDIHEALISKDFNQIGPLLRVDDELTDRQKLDQTISMLTAIIAAAPWEEMSLLEAQERIFEVHTIEKDVTALFQAYVSEHPQDKQRLDAFIERTDAWLDQNFCNKIKSAEELLIAFEDSPIDVARILQQPEKLSFPIAPVFEWLIKRADEVDPQTLKKTADILNRFKQEGVNLTIKVRAGVLEREISQLQLAAAGDPLKALLTHDTKEKKEGIIRFEEMSEDTLRFFLAIVTENRFPDLNQGQLDSLLSTAFPYLSDAIVKSFLIETNPQHPGMVFSIKNEDVSLGLDERKIAGIGNKLLSDQRVQILIKEVDFTHYPSVDSGGLFNFIESFGQLEKLTLRSDSELGEEGWRRLDGYTHPLNKENHINEITLSFAGYRGRYYSSFRLPDLNYVAIRIDYSGSLRMNEMIEVALKYKKLKELDLKWLEPYGDLPSKLSDILSNCQ